MTTSIEVESSIWDTANKEKLPTCTINNETTSAIVNGETLQIVKERKLINRTLAPKSWSELDLSKNFSTYDFALTNIHARWIFVFCQR